MKGVTLRATLRFTNADGRPVTADEALEFWSAIKGVAKRCGLVTVDANCEFDGLDATEA